MLWDEQLLILKAAKNVDLGCLRLQGRRICGSSLLRSPTTFLNFPPEFFKAVIFLEDVSVVTVIATTSCPAAAAAENGYAERVPLKISVWLMNISTRT